MTTPPQNPEELSVWLAVFKARVRDGLLFDSAESEANAALAEHRDRVGWPSSTSVNEAQPAQSFDSWLATDAEPQKLVRSVVDHISASIDYALRHGAESSSHRTQRRRGSSSPQAVRTLRVRSRTRESKSKGCRASAATRSSSSIVKWPCSLRGTT